MITLTPDQIKENIYSLVKEYFTGAEVYWMEERGVKSALPFVTLKLSSLLRSQFPITREENGELVKYYPSETTLEINLYTCGKSPPPIAGKVSARRNTALSDLSQFVSFIMSEYAISFMEENNLEIVPTGPVRDVTALLGGSQFEFRAMQEFSVTFVQEAREWAGIGVAEGSEWQQASGGGTEELAGIKTGWADAVEVIGE